MASKRTKKQPATKKPVKPSEPKPAPVVTPPAPIKRNPDMQLLRQRGVSVKDIAIKYGISPELAKEMSKPG